MSSTLTHPHAGHCQLAKFRLGELLLGIDIQAIREIIRATEFTPVPDAPPSVRGVVNLRGDVVTVVDLRMLLSLPQQDLTPHTRLIVMQSDGEQIGLLVDCVADVVTVDASDREPLPANISGVDGRFFSGVFTLGDTLLLMLDVCAALYVADA